MRKIVQTVYCYRQCDEKNNLLLMQSPDGALLVELWFSL